MKWCCATLNKRRWKQLYTLPDAVSPITNLLCAFSHIEPNMILYSLFYYLNWWIWPVRKWEEIPLRYCLPKTRLLELANKIPMLFFCDCLYKYSFHSTNTKDLLPFRIEKYKLGMGLISLAFSFFFSIDHSVCTITSCVTIVEYLFKNINQVISVYKWKYVVLEHIFECNTAQSQPWSVLFIVAYHLLY